MARGVKYTTSVSLSVAGTAVGFTAATIAGLNRAFVVVESAIIRYWVDGTTATATSGVELFPGDILTLDDLDQLTQFSAISRDGGTATLRCQFGA